MDTHKTLFWNKAMTWGAVIGGVMAVEMLIAYFANTYFMEYRTWITWVIYVAGIYFSTKAFTAALGENEPFTYGRALGLATATLMFSGIVAGLVTFLLFNFDPEFMNSFYTNAEELLLKSGFGEDMIEKQIEMQKKLMSPVFIGFSQFFNNLFYGFLFGLITSIFLRRKGVGGFDQAMSELDDNE